MTGNLRMRAAMVLALVLLFGFYSGANFVPKSVRLESGALPDEEGAIALAVPGAAAVSSRRRRVV